MASVHKGSSFKIVGRPPRQSFGETRKRYGLSKSEAQQILDYMVEAPHGSRVPRGKKAAKK